jgi:hypothetical protein
MSNNNHVVNISGEHHFPRGFTISDNRIEDDLQKFLTPAEYVIWRQYLRFWGSNKRKAYPSLSYLKESTGLSEKTIRKCNKELKEKKFLTYVSGKSGKSNLYTYKPIEEIMKHYYGTTVVGREEKSERTPIYEAKDIITIGDFLQSLNDQQAICVSVFLNHYLEKYKEILGYEYNLDKNDEKSIKKQITDLCSNIDRYVKLIDAFFTSKNSYIQKSDRSIYFFFTPKIKKILISEQSQTDQGRWDAQAEEIWNKIKEDVSNRPNRSGIKDWLTSKIHFSGANKTRDEYVINCLIKKTEEY